MHRTNKTSGQSKINGNGKRSFECLVILYINLKNCFCMFKDFATIKKLSDELALYEKSLEFGKGFKTVYGGNLDDY